MSDYITVASKDINALIYHSHPSHVKYVSSLPMQSKIHPTVPSPPQASTLKSGTSRKKFNLKNKHVMAHDWYFKIRTCKVLYSQRFI